MAIRFQCECGKVLMASDDQAGLEGQCPACEKIITIPQSGSLDMAGILDKEERRDSVPSEHSEAETPEMETSEGIKGLEDLERGLVEKVRDQQPRWSSGRSSRFVMLTSIIVVFLVAVAVFVVVLRDKETSQEPIIIRKLQPMAETEVEESAPSVGAKLEEEAVQPEESQPTAPTITEGESEEGVSTEASAAGETEVVAEEKKEEVVASIKAETPSIKKGPEVGAYTINVASFRQKEGAERYVKDLGKMGIDAFEWEVDIPQKGKWYRVSVGSFPTREEAANYAGELRKKGISDIFITKVPGTS